MKKLAQLIWTLTRAVVHIAQGYWTIKSLFHKLGQEDQEQRVHVWAQEMLAIVGITLTVQGEPPSNGPVLFVANHISWLDIVVMHAGRSCRFISKSDIKHWPFVSTLAHGAGTLYLERESRRDAHRMVQLMAERLLAGDVLAVFPEGTTGDGITLKPFHANLIQAAIDADVHVQPVALKFLDGKSGAVSFAPRYVDDDTLWGSIWNTLTAPPLRAVLTFGSPQLAQGKTRREWAQTLRVDVDALRSAAHDTLR